MFLVGFQPINRYLFMKKILVLNAHPDPESYCSALAQQYGKAVKEHRGDWEQINIQITTKFIKVVIL